MDEIIRWADFYDYVVFKKNKYEYVSVQFKNNGTFMYSKGYGTSYEAKIDVINYLKSLGKIKILNHDEIKLKFV